MKFNVAFTLATTDDIRDLIEIQNQAFYDDYIKFGECPGYGRTYESMKHSVENCIVYITTVDYIPVYSCLVKRS